MMSDSQFDFDDDEEDAHDGFYGNRDEKDLNKTYSRSHSESEKIGFDQKSHRYDESEDDNYSDDHGDYVSYSARNTESTQQSYPNSRNDSSRLTSVDNESEEERTNSSSRNANNDKQRLSISTQNNTLKGDPSKKPPMKSTHTKKNASVKGRGKGRGTKRKDAPPPGRQSGKTTMVVDRVLSANRHKARALHNVIHELQQQVDTLTIENRDLKRAARLQDREIKKLDNAEADLPALLKKHSSEMHVLQERFKRQKEASDKARDNLKRRDDEMYKCKEKLKKYEEMAKDNNLVEKSTLNKKLENLEKDIENRDKKITELSRAVQLNEKVRNRELKDKNEKYKRAIEEFKRLESEHKELQRKLKDKEKALEVTNIYSQRLNQRRGSKESQGLFSETDPVPAIIRRHQEEQEIEYAESIRKAFLTEREAANASESSEGTRGKMFTEDFEAKRLSKKKHPKKTSINPQAKNPFDEPVKTLVNNRTENSKPSNDNSDENDEEVCDDTRNSVEDRRLEEIDRKLSLLKKHEDQLEKRKIEKENERLNEENKLREIEEKRHRKRQFELERELMVEEEKRIEKQRQREEEEHMSRLKEQQTIAEQPKEEMHERNKEEEEKKRKRELLIARMKAIDKGEDPEQIEVPVRSPVARPRKKKPIFLENESNVSSNADTGFLLQVEPLDISKPNVLRRNTNDNIKSSPNVDYDSEPFYYNKPAIPRRNTNDSIKSNKSDRRNSWDFKRTDENMHKGLPSNTGLKHSSPKISRNNTEDSIMSGHSGKGDRCLQGASGDRRNRRAVLLDEDLDTAYSPSSLNNSPAHKINPVSGNKNNQSVFEQFDDPFHLNKPKNSKPKSKLVFSSDEDDDLDTPAYHPSKPVTKRTPLINYNHRSNVKSSENDDYDIEEMLIG